MEGKWAPQIGKENKYGYNGKELDEDFGLNWHHYGFRMYDAAIARFPSADPAAEQFSWVSPYNYAENSPIANTDLWGLQAWSVHNSWDEEKVAEYRNSVADKVSAYKVDNKDFTCEDLCLSTVMEFARDNNLPFKFTTGDQNFDASSVEYNNYESFSNDVLKKSAAADIDNDANSSLKTLGAAESGDLLMSTRKGSESAHHVGLITGLENSKLKGFQGNFSRDYGKKAKIANKLGFTDVANPQHGSYIGAPIQPFIWNLKTNVYHSKGRNSLWGSPSLNFSKSEKRTIREFNFLNWNN